MLTQAPSAGAPAAPLRGFRRQSARQGKARKPPPIGFAA